MQVDVNEEIIKFERYEELKQNQIYDYLFLFQKKKKMDLSWQDLLFAGGIPCGELEI